MDNYSISSDEFHDSREELTNSAKEYEYTNKYVGHHDTSSIDTVNGDEENACT
jgi:hypothetical protein